MSHAEAMRSTWGRGRVTQRRPLSAARSRGGAAPAGRARPEAVRCLDGFPRPLDFPAAGRFEEVDLGDPAHLAGEPGQLLGEPRPAALEQLAVALREGRVVLVASLLEQAHHVRLLHVLDPVHAKQGGLAAVALDLLGEPLELLVAIRRIGQEVGRAPERHRAEPSKPPPGADAQARGAGWETQQQE